MSSLRAWATWAWQKKPSAVVQPKLLTTLLRYEVVDESCAGMHVDGIFEATVAGAGVKLDDISERSP